MSMFTGLTWYGWLIVVLAIASVFFAVLAIRGKWVEVDSEIERHI